MISTRHLPWAALNLPVALCGLVGIAAIHHARADKSMIDFSATGVERRISSNVSDGTTTYKVVDGAAGKALEVDCAPAAHGNPGIVIKPDGAAWDITGTGEVDIDVTNPGEKPLSLFARVDNGGDWHASPWDMNRGAIPAGKTGTVKVTFGYSFDAVGYALDPSKVTQILLFTNKLTAPISFRVDAVRAVGQPGEKPAGYIERLKPADGVVVNGSFPASQIKAVGATTSATGKGTQIAFAPGAASVLFEAPDGAIWDLSGGNQVDFTLANPAAQPVHVICRVDNRYANATSNSASATADLPAGATKTVTVPFMSATSWDGDVKGSGSSFASDNVVGVAVLCDKGGTVQVQNVRAVRATATDLPSWLGQRPPVDGAWTKTLDENFDGNTLNTKLWVVPPAPQGSIWDTQSVEVADHATVSDGLLKIKVDKPAMMPASDPKLASRTLLTCEVTSFDKWSQRYGYFEARMKLPTTMGMWPAFWLMPDRGPAAGNKWQRQDTKNGGMEFDIMEHLVRFGPNRYNIAMHWDGYGKLHKATGSENIYFQPDKDGFVTSGLLWGPRKVTFYCNGRTVGTWANERIGNTPEYILFTMPVGGWGTGGYVDTGKLPAEFQVKYVRVWQLADWKALP